MNQLVDIVSGRTVRDTPEERCVQEFARRLIDDFGYTKDRLQTHPQFRVRSTPSSRGTARTFPVDIAAFRDARHEEDNLFLIVECKRHGATDGLDQLKLYLSMSRAEYGVWFTGGKPLFIRKTLRRDGACSFEDVPTLPPFGATDFGDILRRRREELAATDKTFSLRKVAERLGVTPAYLSRIERGEIAPPSDARLIELARELRLDEHILFANAGKLHPELREVIKQRPVFFAQLMHEIRDMSDAALIEVTRRVRDGEW